MNNRLRPQSISFEFSQPLDRGGMMLGELLVDGRPLREHVERAWKNPVDSISPLGWTTDEFALHHVERLLLRREPELISGRRELLVCPQCADLGCGCISVKVEEQGDFYVWSDFGYENDYEEESLCLIKMSKMVFRKTDLLHLFRSVVPGLD